MYDRGDVCDNIEETLSFSRGLLESDDIDNEDVAYVLEDCEGVYVEEDIISGKKRKRTWSILKVRKFRFIICFLQV